MFACSLGYVNAVTIYGLDYVNAPKRNHVLQDTWVEQKGCKLRGVETHYRKAIALHEDLEPKAFL